MPATVANSAPTPSSGGLTPTTTLGVNPSAISFGSLAIGSSQGQSGSLTAGGADVVISTASWSGQGYALTGISFPATISARASIPFTVTFTPQTPGAATGQVLFFNNASASPTVVNLTGTGSQSVQHSVSLSWLPSASPVTGYNVYRTTQPSGPYVRLNNSLIVSLAFSDNTVQPSTTYYYAATSLDSNNVESAYSNLAVAVVP